MWGWGVGGGVSAWQQCKGHEQTSHAETHGTRGNAGSCGTRFPTFFPVLFRQPVSPEASASRQKTRALWRPCLHTATANGVRIPVKESFVPLMIHGQVFKAGGPHVLSLGDKSTLMPNRPDAYLLDI